MKIKIINLKLLFLKYIAQLFSYLIFIIVLCIKPKKNTMMNNYYWLIIVSEYQLDILKVFLLKKGIVLDIKYSPDMLWGQVIVLEICYGQEKLKLDYQIRSFKNSIKLLFNKSKTEFPTIIYLSSLSPLLFNNINVYSFFKALSHIVEFKYIDDGLTGIIKNNRLKRLGFCPPIEETIRLNFSFLNEQFLPRNTLPFENYLKLLKAKHQTEKKYYDNCIDHLVIASKYFNYSFIIEKIMTENSADYYYKTHPRKWKNNAYLLENCKLLECPSIESFILNECTHVRNIYIGISATTLILAELLKRNLINCKLHIILSKDSHYIDIREFYEFIFLFKPFSSAINIVVK